MTRQRQRTRRKPWYVEKNPSHFANFFDFSEAAEVVEPQFAHAPPADPALEVARACVAWRDSGGVIVRMGFGVRSKHIGFYPDDNPLPRIYEPASTHVSPEGCVLIRQEARGDILNDFRAVLNVDEYWACGFHHAVSQTQHLTGKLREHFVESETYEKGFEAGLEIAATYMMVLGGWQEPFHKRTGAL